MLGAVAVVLSAIRLYGLLAYAVATDGGRARMALGAARLRGRMVLRESLMLAAIGLIVSVPAALAGTRVLESMLFGLAAISDLDRRRAVDTAARRRRWLCPRGGARRSPRRAEGAE